MYMADQVEICLHLLSTKDLVRSVGLGIRVDEVGHRLVDWSSSQDISTVF